MSYRKIHKIPKTQKIKIIFTAKFRYRIWDDEGKEDRKEKGEKKERGGKNLR